MPRKTWRSPAFKVLPATRALPIPASTRTLVLHCPAGYRQLVTYASVGGGMSVYNDEWDLLVGDGARNWVRAILLIFVVYVFHVCLSLILPTVLLPELTTVTTVPFLHFTYSSLLAVTTLNPSTPAKDPANTGPHRLRWAPLLGARQDQLSQAVLQCAEPLGLGWYAAEKMQTVTPPHRVHSSRWWLCRCCYRNGVGRQSLGTDWWELDLYMQYNRAMIQRRHVRVSRQAGDRSQWRHHD
jgi:hypothetical protein